jgi:hypothetical protein
MPKDSDLTDIFLTFARVVACTLRPDTHYSKLVCSTVANH